jgi:ATP-dependent Lhr-like helicase
MDGTITPEKWRAPVEAWFAARGWEPFGFQREVWDAYLRGESGLIHATTGAGKTYAAWIGPLAEWIVEHPHSPTAKPRAPVPLRVVWLTPLRALAADTAAALQVPVADLGLPWTVETRTSDTSSAARARQRQRLPTALVTTPESLSLLLTRPDASTLFGELRAVVVDEWHELLATKRGVQTELCLARLRHLRPTLRTWGLSATLGNLDAALEALVGRDAGRGMRDEGAALASLPPRIIRGLAPKEVVIDALIPPEIERFPWAGHLGLKLLPQVVEAIAAARTTLVFTNTRAQTEIWYQAILDARPAWAGEIALHHGSLDRATREWVEAALRDGRVRCVVCTSSLDLGVDFAPVERVIQVGSPKGVARLLQRAGRSGHRPGVASRATCAPTNALELVEIAAARAAAAQGQIESRPPVTRPLDLLAQHMVTVALGGGFRADELLAEVRTTHAFRELSDAEWQWTLDFVTRGGEALRAYPEYQRVVERDGVYVVVDERVARRHRMAIGTIVSDAMITVQYQNGANLGLVEEAFVARLKTGDRFVLAGKVVEFVRVRDLKAQVRRASSGQGVVPRWAGGRLPLSGELARAVREKLDAARVGVFDGPELTALRPILELQARWSRIPAANELLVERVRTREGHHLFFYPFEGRLVHEGLAALFAYRLSQHQSITFTLAANDYGFELLSPEPAPLAELLGEGTDVQHAPLLGGSNLLEDIGASLNAAELAKRQFREVARVAGLIVEGYPGEKSLRQVQASAGLLYDVFTRYDPGNLLLRQAEREVLERQLEASRLAATLARLRAGRVSVVETGRPTPLAFPLLVDRLREKVSSESLAERVRKMQLQLEHAADA